MDVLSTRAMVAVHSEDSISRGMRQKVARDEDGRANASPRQVSPRRCDTRNFVRKKSVRRHRVVLCGQKVAAF